MQPCVLMLVQDTHYSIRSLFYMFIILYVQWVCCRQHYYHSWHAGVAVWIHFRVVKYRRAYTLLQHCTVLYSSVVKPLLTVSANSTVV